MLTAGTWFCVTTPVFKVPDEDAHIFRADQVSQGHLFAWETRLNSGGGQVDQGYADLILFMRELSARQGEWLSEQDIDKIKSFRAIGHRTTQGFQNTASYFAAGYVPQAVGLLIGRLFSDKAAYHIVASRIANLLAFVAVMTAALLVFPSCAPAFLCLSLMPMVLFLSSSASQDASIISVSALSSALYLRIFSKGVQGPASRNSAVTYSLIGLSVCLLFLSLARPVCFPFFVLLPTAAIVLRNMRLFVLSVGLCTLAALCMIAQIYHISSLGVPSGKEGIDPVLQMHFLLIHPMEYVNIIYRTWQEQSYFLVSTFIGVLGQLDHWLPRDTYASLKTFIALAGVFQFLAFLKQDWSSQLPFGFNLAIVLGASFLTSAVVAVLIFTSMYLLWTPPGAPVIDGLQGRYFYSPAIMLMTTGLAALAAASRNAFREPENVQFFDPTLVSYAIFLPGIVASQFMVGSTILTYYR